MTVGDTRIIHSIQCRFLKKGSTTPTTPRPATVTVTPGKITVVAHEDKFASFTLKTTDFVKPPKAPGAKSVTWLSLDCVQHVHAKYKYICFQVDRSKMKEVIDTLLFAWEGMGNDSTFKMTVGNTRIIESVQCCFMKKDSLTLSTLRPVKVTITPGKITITSLEDKYEPFTVKTTDFLNPPRAPTRKTHGWVSLDCVQHVKAKYTYINFNTDATQVNELVDALMFAWSFNKMNDSNYSGIFADDADEMVAPVHEPLRNSKQEVKPVAVHSNTALNKSLREPAAKQPSKKSYSYCRPPSAKKIKLSDPIEAVKEYKEIEKEFILLAEKVFRLEKKGREDVVKLMKEIVEDAVKSEE